jgi:hypothetical protein
MLCEEKSGNPEVHQPRRQPVQTIKTNLISIFFGGSAIHERNGFIDKNLEKREKNAFKIMEHFVRGKKQTFCCTLLANNSAYHGTLRVKLLIRSQGDQMSL